MIKMMVWLRTINVICSVRFLKKFIMILCSQNTVVETNYIDGHSGFILLINHNKTIMNSKISKD